MKGEPTSILGYRQSQGGQYRELKPIAEPESQTEVMTMTRPFSLPRKAARSVIIGLDTALITLICHRQPYSLGVQESQGVRQ